MCWVGRPLEPSSRTRFNCCSLLIWTAQPHLQLWHVAAACLLILWCFKYVQETIEIFFSPKLGIKEQQSLAKIPDTLVCAMEFITLPTSATQEAAFATLRSATLRLHPELKVNYLWACTGPLCSCTLVGVH